MKNATARPVVPNLAPMESALEKAARAARFSCARRLLTTRSKRPSPSEVGLPKIESIFKEDWLLGFTQGGAFSFERRSIWQSKKTS